MIFHQPGHDFFQSDDHVRPGERELLQDVDDTADARPDGI
jgi:hypothetical protein